MNKTQETIKRIPKHYIGDDCIQVMLPYRDSLILMAKNGIQYYSIPELSIYVNKYLEDERRKQFPYHNIPNHYERNWLIKYNYTNQILNFEESYIEINNGMITEMFVIKDKTDAIIISKTLDSREIVKYMTRKELEKIFEKPQEENKQLFVILIDKGLIFENSSRLTPFKTEKEIIEITKKGLLTGLQNYKTEAFEQGNGNIYFDKFGTNCLEKLINNLTIDQIPPVDLDNKDRIIVKTDGKEIFLQKVSVTFIHSDYYKVTTTTLPVTKYSLEQIKQLALKISTLKEPKISLSLNPNISKQEIEKSKKLLKRKY